MTESASLNPNFQSYQRTFRRSLLIVDGIRLLKLRNLCGLAATPSKSVGVIVPGLTARKTRTLAVGEYLSGKYVDCFATGHLCDWLESMLQMLVGSGHALLMHYGTNKLGLRLPGCFRHQNDSEAAEVSSTARSFFEP